MDGIAVVAANAAELASRRARTATTSPAIVTSQLLSALQLCWQMLPEGSRDVDNTCRVATELFNRALQTFRDDAKVFGKK